MAVISRLLALPLLAAVWTSSIVGMALAASLVAHYSNWPGSLGGWTKAVLAFQVTSVALSMLFLLGVLVAHNTLGNVPLNVLVWFPVWALGLTTSIGLHVANDANSCSIQRCLPLGTPCRRPRCSMFRTAEAFAWITWGLLTFYFLALAFSAFHHRRHAARERDLGAGGAGAGGAGAGQAQPQMGQAHG